MCYSGQCIFETHMGDCKVYSHSSFESEIKYTACFVGGGQICCQEEYDMYNKMNERGEIDKLIEQAIVKKLIWR